MSGVRPLADGAIRIATRPDPFQTARGGRPRRWKHLADLRALEPTPDELVVAARWARTHDPSEGFLNLLTETLAYLGVEDAGLGA